MRLDNARSLVVLAFASDAVLEAHNAFSYGKMRPIRGLFDWEQRIVSDHFPPAPARVLIGGAGIGREAFALAEMGYSATAFEPVSQLVAEMRATNRNSSDSVQVFRGAYRDMPILRDEPPSNVHDLRNDPPFDAAIIGWSSFSHLPTDAERVETLRRFADVTRGPILASFFSPGPEHRSDERGAGFRAWIRRRAGRRGLARFVMRGGYCRLLSAEDVERVAKEAGVTVIEKRCHQEGNSYAVFLSS